MLAPSKGVASNSPLTASCTSGREEELVAKLTENLADITKVEQNPSMMGRRIVVIYAPK